jgi:hypothetical protein
VGCVAGTKGSSAASGHLGAPNDWRAAAYGRNTLGLTVVNVPQLILAVCAAGHVQKVKAHQMLAKIANITAPALMHKAARVLNELP